MNHEELAEQAAILRSRYRQLWQDAQREVSLSEPYSALADGGDEATADVIVDTRLAEVDRDIGEMRQVSAALKRISEGRYGICVDCGEDIASERLRASPEAARCLACQDRHEAAQASARPASL